MNTTAIKQADKENKQKQEQLVQAQAVTEFLRCFRPSQFRGCDQYDDVNFEREFHYLLARQTAIAQQPLLDHLHSVVVATMLPMVHLTKEKET